MVIFLSFTANNTIITKAAEENNVHLILDSLDYNDVLPKNFRKTSDLSTIQDNKDLNLKGVEQLNISGSQQFSEYNLPILVKAIGTSLPITVVDLRQESHGFINGFAVSWANSKNNANEGLTREQVLEDETSKLKSIKLNIPITFYNHPGKIIVPTKVQDENELVKTKDLLYNRITVRDGGIPSDDMVDYFIDFVKTQPKNSWLHFHCKEGVGRTTLFMIMYDMIKNYKEVNVDEIIKRQLALAGFDEKNISSFYNNKEKVSFLNKFYDYCKANGNSFNLKWSEWNKTAVTSASIEFKKALSLNKTSAYIKNAEMPKSLCVISLDSITPSERTMVASLQGLVNSHCSFQIYTLNSSQPDYKIWLEDLINNYNISYNMISDPWQLLNMYKDYIEGYILYSNKIPKDPSINNACSLAALSKSIIIDEVLEAKVKEHDIKMKGDCRNTDESWAYNNLWNNGLNHSTVIELSPERIDPLRDYAIMTKSLVFYEDSAQKTTLREKIFSSMKGNAICLGWGPDEHINVSTASKCGVSIVAADWAYNLSTLSSFPSIPLEAVSSMSIPKEENVHYVTFIMSDGDNLQWNLGTNYTSTKWFGYSNRDKLSLGWSMSPALYYLAPTVFKMYYRSIGSGNVHNNFIVSPSGNGYMYPSKFAKNKLSKYINSLNNYMGAVQEKYVAVIDDSSFYNINLWNKFTEMPNISGLFYLDYIKHDNYQGKIVWSNNKPIVSCRDLLWNSLESEDELVKNINDRINSGQVNVHSPEAYSFVYVHVWSKDVSNVEEVINKLRENSNVRIVVPEVFMELIKENVRQKTKEKPMAFPSNYKICSL
ncbi:MULTISPECIES: GxGYxYP domain-containing protein [unclassified Clostridium]|uniref:GxGYxYP domain-containing protein n=1 Tax=unclassified Clostridium TaxID=2614128 RepID=UPI001FA8E031|nr:MULTISPECIES: GxGYxYP domain-containing protein [unclassified Clostridium]